MKQQRKFENKKILSIGNIGQKSIYFGLIISTVLIMLIDILSYLMKIPCKVICFDYVSIVVDAFRMWSNRFVALFNVGLFGCVVCVLLCML